MSLGWKVFAAVLVLVGLAVLICMVAWWWTGRRGPSTSGRRVVRVACIFCDARVDEPHEDCCAVAQASATPARAPVDEVLFFAALARMEEQLDSITEGGYRLPGERAS